MNNKGIVFLYRLMLGMVIIILGIALAFPTKQPIDNSKSSIGCAAPASDFDEAACYALDFIKFLLPGMIILLGVFVLTKLT